MVTIINQINNFNYGINSSDEKPEIVSKSFFDPKDQVEKRYKFELGKKYDLIFKKKKMNIKIIFNLFLPEKKQIL